MPLAVANLFFEKKFDIKTATAVELCKNMAALIPENADNILLSVDCFNQLRN